MDLKKLIRKVERLKRRKLDLIKSKGFFKGNKLDVEYHLEFGRLQGIKQTVEAVESLGHWRNDKDKMIYAMSDDDYKDWKKLKTLLEIKDGYSTNYEIFIVFRKSPFTKFKHIPVPSKSGNYNAEVNIGSVWRHCKISSNHKEGCKHPTQKPIKFLKRFVETFAEKGDLVLDPFMGSGTTAVACKELGRNFIGFEINKEYIEMANKRLEQKTLEVVNSSQP